MEENVNLLKMWIQTVEAKNMFKISVEAEVEEQMWKLLLSVIKLWKQI